MPPQDRQAIFLGDLIDRGPEQLKVVRIVRSMIDAGHARSVMANHEFNAIGYAMPRLDEPTEFMRRHSPKNVAQHVEFLRQVGANSARHHEVVEWFKGLPPTLDLGGIRVVHAWWYLPYVDLVASRLPSSEPMDEAFLYEAYAPGSPLSTAMEGLTRGLEVRLPDGHAFVDHGGIERYDVRTKWWHEGARSYRDVAIVGRDQQHRVPDHPLPAHYVGAAVEGVPVLIGHYWMSGTPDLQTPNVACLD